MAVVLMNLSEFIHKVFILSLETLAKKNMYVPSVKEDDYLILKTGISDDIFWDNIVDSSIKIGDIFVCYLVSLLYKIFWNWFTNE